MTTEQPVPIEQLLKDTDTALELGGWDYKIPNSTVRRLVAELRLRLEREQQSDVEAVLIELQKLCPNTYVVIHELEIKLSPYDTSKSTCTFRGHTLLEAQCRKDKQ